MPGIEEELQIQINDLATRVLKLEAAAEQAGKVNKPASTTAPKPTA